MNNTLNLLSRWAIAASLAILAACGGGGGGGSPAVTTTDDSIVATSSTTSAIDVAVGSSTAFSVTFTTSDGKTATNLSITTGLSALPAGWTGPTTFACASVSTGSGCMVNLTYKPTAPGSGTVTLDYSYTNDAGTSETGTATVSYAATSNDNVVATASPAGQIAAVTGSTNAVSLTFTTDDGQSATNLSITSGLGTLPAGWTGPTTFACASVNTGAGCILHLTYKPTTAGSGSLTVDYHYADNAGTAKTGTAKITYTATSQDNVVATQSPAGQIAVTTGATSPVGITFTTDDGQPAKNLSITAGLTTLPAGWTGPATFACASVSTGSGCLLNLVYHPTTSGSGTVTLNYSYTNNAGTGKTGTVMVSYAATDNNTVIATPSPTGQIAVVTGGNSALSITFTTSDGQPATNLSITAGLSPLPTGWTAAHPTFTCASVSTGNGCLLSLHYAPTVVGSGTLTLNYSYKNNAGTAKTGSIGISFAATTQNHVIGTTTPAGQIVAVIGGSQAVTVNFTTDDSNPATNLAVTPANLTSLPAGWTTTHPTFTCASVSTGNGCQLSLTYTPTVITPGTVTLNFTYTNNSGVASTGMVSITYAGTTDNTVIGTPSPSGTINAVVGGSQAVTVTFNTNDANPASHMAITGGLGTLPAGWSGPATFTCASVNTGNSCQLSLTYTPLAAASGTLQLNYGYNANSGTAKTGSVTIPYAATTNNSVVATASPSGSISAVVNSGSVPVTLTFTTDDGNPATSIAITSGLGTLPPGWSGPATFTCATATTGTGCQLALTYAPTVNGSGTVSLGYSYINDAGTAETGTANIAYASIPGFLYFTDSTSTIVSCAVSGVDGSLSACANVTTGLSAPTGIAFSGNFAYVTPGIASTDVDVCPVNANGTLGTCTSAQTFSAPSALAVSGGYLYIADGSTVYNCPINADGSLGTCDPSYIGTVSLPSGIGVTGTTAYIVDIVGGSLTTCTVDSDGTLFPCTQQTLDGTAPGGGNTPNASPRSTSVYGGNLYIGTTAGNMILPIAGDGTVTPVYSPTFCSLTPGTSCTIDGVPPPSSPVQTPLTGFAFNNGYAYVAGLGHGGGVGICTIETSGVLDNCVNSPTPSLSGYGGIAVH